MTRPAWRRTNNTRLLDTPSLWVNFLEFPREFDTEESLVHPSDTPEYEGELLTASTPTASADASSRQEEAPRYETVRDTRLDRYNGGRHYRAAHRPFHARRGPGSYRNRFYNSPS